MDSPSYIYFIFLNISQTIPKELTPLIKQLEEMKSVVAAEAKKKNPPSTIYNARSYIAYMSQV